MRFEYSGHFGSDEIGPYERLIHDALLGDRTLFTRADGLERDPGRWSSPVLTNPPPMHSYPQGSWGPGRLPTS